MTRSCWSHDNYRPAMSFEDIGARLGMTKQRVFDEYQRALNKLRQSPESAQWLAVVVAQQSGYGLCLPRRRNRGCA
jgi:DNA-directed RNA polymerase sigma subunit (sigma70/sigma32)